MQFVISNWQSVCCNLPGGNRTETHGLRGCIMDEWGGDQPFGKTLTQTICTMKSPRKQNNGNAVGTVRTGISYAAEIHNEDALPRFPEPLPSENPMPREIPLPEEESFRAFLSSRLPKQKASQALRDRVRSSIEKNEIW